MWYNIFDKQTSAKSVSEQKGIYAKDRKDNIIMTKNELARVVAAKTDFTVKDSEKAVAAVFEAITETLCVGEKVTIVGFGTFEVRERAEREGYNPAKREKIIIPADKHPVLKAGTALKEAVSNS